MNNQLGPRPAYIEELLFGIQQGTIAGDWLDGRLQAIYSKRCKFWNLKLAYQILERDVCSAQVDIKVVGTKVTTKKKDGVRSWGCFGKD